MTESIGNLTYLTIEGVDVSSFVVDWDYQTGIEEGVDEAHILVVKTIKDYTSVNNGGAVIIKRGKTTGQESYIFRGSIATISPKGAFLELNCQDKLSALANKEITNVYENQKISDTAQDLIEAGGLTASVEDSGDSSVLDRFICNYDKIYERLQTLRKIMNWAMYYDPENDVVVFKNKGSTTNPYVVRYDTTGTTNVGGILRWDYDTENMVNSITVIGGPVLDWKYETFSGTGAQTEFTLASTPEHVEVEYPAGTRNALGITDGKSAYDFTVDKSTKKITFVTPPGAGADNIIVNYATYVPVTVQRKDEDSISTYGAVEDTYYYPDILTIADAELKAQEILDRFSTPIPTTSGLLIEQPTTPIRPGDKIQVQDTVNNVIRELIVTNIQYNWPQVHDSISLGMELIMDRLTVTEIEERVSKLEKREAQNVDFVNIVVSFNDYLRVKGELIVQEIDTSLDGAWGVGFSNNTDSKILTWGAAGAVWQSSYTGATTTTSITHQDDQYEEEFMDTDYVVTAETTVTIDTSAGTVTF